MSRGSFWIAWSQPGLVFTLVFAQSMTQGCTCRVTARPAVPVRKWSRMLPMSIRTRLVPKSSLLGLIRLPFRHLTLRAISAVPGRRRTTSLSRLEGSEGPIVTFRLLRMSVPIRLHPQPLQSVKCPRLPRRLLHWLRRRTGVSPRTCIVRVSPRAFIPCFPSRQLAQALMAGQSTFLL